MKPLTLKTIIAASASILLYGCGTTALEDSKEVMQLTAGEFQRIYNPGIGETNQWYINDHCFIQDKAGLWYMFGITSKEPAQPWGEVFFAHATSKQILGPDSETQTHVFPEFSWYQGDWAPAAIQHNALQWKKQEHVLHVKRDKPWNEAHVWAPYIVEHENKYYMYYCAGAEEHSRYKINLAVSDDLWIWERHEDNPMVVDGYDARDPMIIRYDDTWIMYYTANSTPTGGNHVVAAVTSKDLIHWSDKQEVFVHPKTGTYGGPTESPYVVERNGKFHLFVCSNAPYNTSEVYESDSPFKWDLENKVGFFPSHASEVIYLPSENKYYISRAGWGQGGLYLAELNWSESSKPIK